MTAMLAAAVAAVPVKAQETSKPPVSDRKGANVHPSVAGTDPSRALPLAPAQFQPSGSTSGNVAQANTFSFGDSDEAATSGDDRYENTFRTAPKHFLMDQKAMWTSPARVRIPEATWLVPLGGFAAGLLATDTDSSRHLNSAPNTLHHYQQVSNYGVGAMAGAAGGLYFLGLATHNRHERETGFLSVEAAVDSLVAVEALKYMTRRERPLVDNADGNFWSGGDSFPSEHAAAAWSIAGVVAHEYRGPLPKIAAYGLATAISSARVTGKKHFPSDALVGSAIGWLVGYYVYKQHHDPELVGASWGIPAVRPNEDSHWNPGSMGSPYVPMESWIYPALTRLASMSYIDSDFEGMRPWTRMECARLVQEAGDHLSEDASQSKAAGSLYDSLAREFSRELNLLGGGNNAEARLESVYARMTGISGAPLRDGYDFGQTITNDHGRPYAEGFNNVSGASAWATDGPFVGYIRGEYQHAPSSPALPAAALAAIAQDQGVPAAPAATSTPSVSQFDMQEGYAGMQVGNWQITFGKQEQWWGPDAGGPMLFSTNAEPIEMLQINRTKPFTLPGFLARLGPIRAQYFLGRISGYHWLFSATTGFTGTWAQALSDQPFISGEKVAVKPTPNMELGFTVTDLFAGAGEPMTLHRWLNAIVPVNNGGPGTSSDAGDARGGFDFSYRIPGLRNWLTFYGDGFTDDEPSPLWGAFSKSAFDSGLYFSHLPSLPKMDLRVEGVFTDNPNSNPVLQHGFFYFNSRYLNGYTNSGNLLGSWIGRQGQGTEAWSTYWLTPQDKVQFNFRHQKVSQQFVPFGGTLTDGGVRGDFWIRNQFSVTASVQYEKWSFPILSPSPETNVSTSVQFTYWPHWRAH
ncbi:MAG TPA: capsule assembly Wzi family protein [Candidatus Acidoferrales bacterium]|nr:capsule assembly Wzi family protein [Candidatus Acidoferrales bacterium]